MQSFRQANIAAATILFVCLMSVSLNGQTVLNLPWGADDREPPKAIRMIGSEGDYCVAITESSDGSNRIYSWRLSTGKLAQQTKRAGLDYSCLALNKDDAAIVFTAKSGTIDEVLEYKVRTGEFAKQWRPGELENRWNFPLALDGSSARCLYSSSDFGTVFDRSTNDVLLKAPIDAAGRVAISPDGEFLAGQYQGLVRVWSISSGDIVAKSQKLFGDISRIAYSPDGKRIAIQGKIRERNKLANLDATTLQIDPKFERFDFEEFARDASAHEFCWSASGNFLAVRRDRHLGIINSNSGEVIADWFGPRQPTEQGRNKVFMSFAANDTKVITACQEDRRDIGGSPSMIVWSCRDLLRKLDQPIVAVSTHSESGAPGLTWTANSKHFIVGDNRGLRFYDATTGQLRYSIPIAGPQEWSWCRLTRSPDGSRLGVNLCYGKYRSDPYLDTAKTFIFDVKTKSPVFQSTGQFLCCVFDESNTHAYLRGAKAIAMVDIKTGKTIKTIEGRFRNNDLCAVPGAKIGMVYRVVDSKTENDVSWHDEKSEGVTMQCEYADNKIFGYDDDGVFSVWDLQESTVDEVIHCHRWRGIHPQRFSVSLDGTRLATAGADGKVRLFDPRTNELIFSCEHRDVSNVAISPDRKFLASTSRSGDTKIWPIPLAKISTKAASKSFRKNHHFETEGFKANVELTKKLNDAELKEAIKSLYRELNEKLAE